MIETTKQRAKEILDRYKDILPPEIDPEFGVNQVVELLETFSSAFTDSGIAELLGNALEDKTPEFSRLCASAISEGLALAIEREDILFYGGLAAVAYGVDIISREWAFIITGVLLILHAYMPGIYHLIAMFAPGEAPARRGRK